MKIFIFNKKTLYMVVISIILVFILLLGVFKYYNTKDVFNIEPYYQGTRDEKIVAFACNIDWGTEYIEEMLSILKEKDIMITFFPTGRWAENNRELLKLIYSNKHEIGNHGYNHLDYDKLNYSRNYEEIKQAHDIIYDIIKEEPKYFAPPSGAHNTHTLEAANQLNYKTILWSIDTIDWRKDSTSNIIVERIKGKLHQSGIILMHPTIETNKALPELINYIIDNGYKIGKISDIL